ALQPRRGSGIVVWQCGRWRVEGGGRRRLAPAFGSGRPDRQGREPRSLRRGRHLRRHSAPGRHAHRQDDRRDQPRQGRPDLHDRGLRHRRRCVRDRPGARGRRAWGAPLGMTPAAESFDVILVGLAAGFFFYNAHRLVSYLRLGRPDERTDHPLVRVRNLVSIGVLQSKILRDPLAGAMHALVFWGFIVLTVGSVEILIQGVAPGFTYAMVLPAWLYVPYVLSQKAFALFVLGAVAWLFYRRLIIRPKRLQGDALEQWDALLILTMIALLMITLILMNVFVGLHDAMWWTHVLILLAFLNDLPYSKHLHVITSLPNVYLSNTSGPGTAGAMRPMD